MFMKEILEHIYTIISIKNYSHRSLGNVNEFNQCNKINGETLFRIIVNSRRK